MADYKQPQKVANPNIGFDVDPNTLKASDLGAKSGVQRVSAGDINRSVVNTQTRVKRGTGAATKGNKYSVNSQ